jgi:hypothetical protein
MANKNNEVIEYYDGNCVVSNKTNNSHNTGETLCEYSSENSEYCSSDDEYIVFNCPYKFYSCQIYSHNGQGCDCKCHYK